LSTHPAPRSSPTPLYIVCSPFRGVGKTLIARLLAEFHAIIGRPVAAFDLADEGPQLADYLPRLATVAEIGDTRGQMALFDRILGGDGAVTVIDLSHRAFRSFFSIAQDIGFFEEARRHAIEPLVLFIATPDPKSARIYGVLRRALTHASLLPVHNKSEPRTAHDSGVRDNAPMEALEIPLLDFPLRAQIDRPLFSFCQLWRGAAADLPDQSEDELLGWMEHAFLQFRGLELFLGCDEGSGRAADPRSWRVAACGRTRQREARRPRADSGREVALDQSGNSILAMLEKAGGRLRVAESRVHELTAEVQIAEHRVASAESWLQMLESEIVDKLTARTDVRPRAGGPRY
jgi:hypothetical protein